MLKCRSCSFDNLRSIIPLGCLPLANGLLKTPDMKKENRYNLEVMLCEKCGLAQLRDLVDSKKLFSEYLYFSSNSETMLKSAAELVARNIIALEEKSFVIEIASNDGYLLQNYVKHNIKVLGIDPAENIANIANKNGIPTMCAFFTEELALDLARQGNKADIIHANNVMAHIPNINGFISGIKLLLKERGKAIIEVPHFLELVRNLEFDTIYHEHVYYFSVQALKEAFHRHALEIYDIERLSLHGGSLRLFVCHSGMYQPQPIVETIINEEASFGLKNSKVYIEFMKKIDSLKKKLNVSLQNLKETGKSIAAYGASAKGTTLLNYFGIGNNFIDFVVDKSTVKQGMYTPGTRLEILHPSDLIKKNITHALLLTWNFVDEIIEQQKEFIHKGGRFIVPLPMFTICP